MIPSSPPLDPVLLEKLGHYDTPTLANALERLDLRPRDTGYSDSSLRCLFPGMAPVIGFAVTATIRAGGPGGPARTEALYDHVGQVPWPRIVVVQDLDDPPGAGAFWGEVQATVFTALGCRGCVTNGTVRDLSEVQATGFAAFASGTCVSHGYARVEDVGLGVKVSGLKVAPWDLLHGDRHGVLSIPLSAAALLPHLADEVVQAEQELCAWARSEAFDPHELGERIAKMRSRTGATCDVSDLPRAEPGT